MSDIFDFRRFAKYFSYDVKRVSVSHGPSLLFFGCFPVVLFLIVGLWGLIFGEGHNWATPLLNARTSVFFVLSLIVMIIMPSHVYGRITEKKAGSSWLMIPASRLEKFLSMILNCFVLIPIVYFALYFATDWLISLLNPEYGAPIIEFSNIKEALIGETEDSPYVVNSVPFILSIITTTIAPFFFGAVYFRKNKVLWTLVLLFVLLVLFSIIMSLCAKAGMFDGVSDYLSSILYEGDDVKGVMKGLVNRINIVGNVTNLIWLGAFGAASWFRIKSLKH